MSLTFEQLTFLLAVLSLGGVVFSIYKHFTNPTIQAETDIKLIQKDITIINTCLTNHMCEYKQNIDIVKKDINDIKIILGRIEEKLKM